MKKAVLLAFVCLISFFAIKKWVRPPAFKSEIEAFIRMDNVKMPPSGCIVFAGSSSFTKWKGMNDSFPGYPIVNRGFGGSSIPDLIRYADEVIIKYHPKQVIIYSGDNDIAFNTNITAQTLLSRFRELFTLIRNKLPETQITVMSIKPSPKRWKYESLMVETNRLINEFISHQTNALFVNVHDDMLTADGNVNSSLFVEDSFHMNARGYAIWTEKLKPVLLH